MASFCSSCGSPLGGGAFCPACGANVQQAQPASVKQAQPAAQPPTRPAVATAAKTSPLAKLAIALVVILFVGAALAAGGIYYVGHRISQKVHEVKASLAGGSATGTTDSSGSSGSSASDPSSGASGSDTAAAHADVCRLLTLEEVSQAIGVTIVGTQPTDDGCSYLAAGTQADMTAKHMSAMAALKGADSKQQQMLQTIAGGLFKLSQSDQPHDNDADNNGKVPVLAVSIDNNAADAQLKLNQSVLGNLGPKEAPLEGIGDEAFDTAGSLLMFRKGNKLVRILYMTCPCNVEAIKPLARTLAGRL